MTTVARAVKHCYDRGEIVRYSKHDAVRKFIEQLPTNVFPLMANTIQQRIIRKTIYGFNDCTREFRA